MESTEFNFGGLVHVKVGLVAPDGRKLCLRCLPKSVCPHLLCRGLNYPHPLLKLMYYTSCFRKLRIENRDIGPESLIII